MSEEKGWLPTLDENEILDITPIMLDRRFIYLSRSVDEVFDYVKVAESEFQRLATQYELQAATSRIRLAGEKNPDTDKAWTAQDRDDLALKENFLLKTELDIAEALVKAARSNIKRIELLVGLTQSLSRNLQSSITTSTQTR